MEDLVCLREPEEPPSSSFSTLVKEFSKDHHVSNHEVNVVAFPDDVASEQKHPRNVFPFRSPSLQRASIGISAHTNRFRQKF